MLITSRFPRPVLLAFVLAIVGCNKETTAPEDSAPAEPSPAEAGAPAEPDAPGSSLPDRDSALAHRLVESEGALLLDVRSPEEFEQGHIDGAHNVPHDQVEQRIEEIRGLVDGKADTPIVVYCKSGRRAGIAKETLLEGGFPQVTNLGGMSDW